MKNLPLSLIAQFPLRMPAGIAAALTGAVLFSAAAVIAPPSFHAMLFGVVASGTLGCFLAEFAARTARFSRPAYAGSRDDAAVPESCREIVAGLVASASHPDPAFRELVRTRLADLSEQVREWSHGRLTFTGTEAWRTAYEKALIAPDIIEYRSVAWLKSGEYWQDLPGKQGMQLNFELLDRGVRIERLLILGWNLWPPELRLPYESICRWIDEQHYRGVWLLLVRESDLAAEQDLLRDFGIYGGRAVGELHCDDYSRTLSYTLSFDAAAVRLAQEHWARLKLFARPYAELVDRAPSNR